MSSRKDYSSPGAVKARRPECAPIVEALSDWLRVEALTPSQACARLFGRNSDGVPLSSGYFYPLMNGLTVPGDDMLTKLAEKGLDLIDAAAAARRYIDEHGQTPGPKAARGSLARAKQKAAAPDGAGLTPVRAVVAAHQEAVTNGHAATTVLEPRKRAPGQPAASGPLLALTIAQDGRASLQLHLADIDGEVALRYLDLLKTAGLVNRNQGE